MVATMLTMAARRRRRRYVALAATVLVVGALVVVKTVVLNDDVHQLTAAEALERYRERTSTTLVHDTRPTTTSSSESIATPHVQALPAPGVYVYTSSGAESIDAVGGSRHVYPAETTITITTEGCGVSLQWNALEERHERWQLCLGDDGIVVPADGSQSFHEFFGQTKTEDLTCDREVVVLPLDGEPRDAVPLTCLLGDLAWQPVWEVLESDTRTVGGAPVPVVHVRMTVTDDDLYYEHIQLDWYLTESGLPVSVTMQKENLSDTAFGDVRYVEQYTLELTSLAPLR